MDRFIGGGETGLIGRTVNIAPPHSPAGQPHGKAVMIVVAAIEFRHCAGRGHFDSRRAPEFATPDHQRVIEHSALLEVFQQCRDGLVAFQRQPADDFLDVSWLSHGGPGRARPGQIARRARSVAGRSESAGPACRSHTDREWLRLARHVKRIGRIHLHPVCELEGLNARFQLRHRPGRCFRAARFSCSRRSSWRRCSTAKHSCCECSRSAFRCPCCWSRCRCPDRRRAENRTANSAIPESDTRPGTSR